ncbi:hypothetical protein BJM06_a00084 (plasmid) [Enterobacter cloacae]|nr:hypothetical protein BJM06_a00084 [Enterobacter cloacae]
MLALNSGYTISNIGDPDLIGPGNSPPPPTHHHYTPYSTVLIDKAVLQSDSLAKYRTSFQYVPFFLSALQLSPDRGWQGLRLINTNKAPTDCLAFSLTR